MVRLAGVSSGVIPRRLAVGAGTTSGETPVPTTPTVSLSPATSSVTASSVRPAASRSTWLHAANPGELTCSVYSAWRRPSKVNIPSAVDCAVCAGPLGGVSRTAAPTTTPPWRSDTRPWMANESCAIASAGTDHDPSTNSTHESGRNIRNLLMELDSRSGDHGGGRPARPGATLRAHDTIAAVHRILKSY